MHIDLSGESLDLYAGQAVTFTNTNPLFAFDKIACERTTQFNVPLTAKNMRLFGCAHVPAYYGEGMRRKFTARMVDGVVVKSGYLYISGYNGKDFQAVFVCGQLVGLQALKNAGKLGEAGTFTDSAVWGATPINASAAASARFASVYYYQDNGAIYPSASLKYIVDTIANELHVDIALPTEANGLRIIPDTPHGFGKDSVTLASSVAEPSQPSTSEPTNNYNTPTASVSGLFSVATAIVSTRIMNVARKYKLAQFSPNQPLKLTCGMDWPETRYIVSFAEDGSQTFLGDRSFTKTSITRTEGEPLAGRTIDIERGTPFIFVDSRDYKNETSSVGWYFGSAAEGMAFEEDVTIEGEAESGCTLMLRDNLPDITITDLLKYVSAITGKQLNYTEEDGVTFDPISLSTWDTIDITAKLMKVSSVKRTFGDYARNNVIQFATASNVAAADRLTETYEVDNDLLADEAVLQEIGFSEGAKKLVSGVDFFRNANANEEADKFGIALAGNNAYMKRVTLTACDGIDSLCTSSTSIVAEVKMSLYEFDKVTPQTALLLNGTRYVWTAVNWTKGVATFTLSKI